MTRFLFLLLPSGLAGYRYLQKTLISTFFGSHTGKVSYVFHCISYIFQYKVTTSTLCFVLCLLTEVELK
jgi:hypothetical protein